MDNRCMFRKITKLVTDSRYFLINASKEYGIEPPEFRICTDEEMREYSQDTDGHSPDGRIYTLMILNNKDLITTIADDDIIMDISAIILMRQIDLYELIIECELDFEKAFECMRFYIRHELGHIISMNRIRGVWQLKDLKRKFSDNYEEICHVMRQSKINTFKNKKEFYLRYNNIPMEKEANDAVDITENDILMNLYRTYNKKIIE